MELKTDKKNIYDNAKNHFLGNFPASLPIEQAYVHIGIYLGWIIETGLYSEYFEDEASNQIFRFKFQEKGNLLYYTQRNLGWVFRS